MTKNLLITCLFVGLAACAVGPSESTADDELTSSEELEAAAAAASATGCHVWESDWDCNGDGVEDYIAYNSNPLLALKNGRTACEAGCPTKTCQGLGPVSCSD